MIAFIASAIILINTGNPAWLNNMDTAKETARKEHKMILLYFSGSDWCIPCISLRKEIYESDVFSKFAEDNLVLVNADFPRNKKNQLPKEQQKINDQLAETYNPNGSFPFSILLDSNGKKIKVWNGYYKNGADNFVNEIRSAAGIN